MALVLTIVRHPEGSVVSEIRKVFGAEGGTLGRSSESTWQLPDPNRLVSASHAGIRVLGDSYFLVDTSTNGVYVNEGKRPLGAGNQVKLSQGDRIFMGEYELVVEYVPGAPPQASPRLAPVTTLASNAMQTPAQTAGFMPPVGSGVAHATASGIDRPATPAARYAPATIMAPERVAEIPALQPSTAFGDELMRLLGIDPVTVPAEARARFAPLVAEWIRETTHGLLKALGARNAIKNEFRINLTSIQAMDNNPLKFSPNLEEALRNMFAMRSNAYMPGPLAVRKSFHDIAMHELAMITGMRAAFEHMMSRFSPATLQDRFDKVGGKSGLLQSRKAHYWECYETHFREMTDNMDDAFQDLFGEEFAEVYEQYILAADFQGKK